MEVFEGRTAPHLEGEQFGGQAGVGLGDVVRGRGYATRVASSDWCASRIVVSVIRRPFCFRIHSLNFSGPSSLSLVRVPSGNGPRSGRRNRHGFATNGNRATFHQLVLVHDYIGDIAKQAVGPVLFANELKQIGILIE